MTAPPIHIQRAPRTPDELHTFVRVIWGIDIPRVKVCPHHVAPFTAFAHSYFAESPVTVWKASRGYGGKSFTLALLCLTEAVTLGAEVNLLGGSGEQAARVLEHMGNLWLHPAAPRYLQAKDPTKWTQRLTNKGRITALLASQKSVRGPHPQRLRMDEVDEMDIEILDAALGQPMAKDAIRSQVVLSSTHQYANGTMTEIIRRAKERGWPYFEWCYRESLQPHGWLDSAEVEAKKTLVTDTMWATEYEGQEPNPEARAIVPESVEDMFRRDLGTTMGQPSVKPIIFEPPVPEARYAAGADWAKEKDWTIIVILRTDVEPARVVAYQRMGRLPWPKMIAAFDSLLDTYPASACHDATGSGDVVDDLIRHFVEGVDIRGRRRDDLLSNYITAVERGMIASPMIDHAYGEHKFASNQDVYGTGHLPDTICAFALAWRARSLRARMRAYVLG